MKDRIGSLWVGADVTEEDSRRDMAPAGISDAAAGLEAMASLDSSSRRMSRLEARRLHDGKPMPVEEDIVAIVRFL